MSDKMITPILSAAIRFSGNTEKTSEMATMAYKRQVAISAVRVKFVGGEEIVFPVAPLPLRGLLLTNEPSDDKKIGQEMEIDLAYASLPRNGFVAIRPSESVDEPWAQSAKPSKEVNQPDYNFFGDQDFAAALIGAFVEESGFTRFMVKSVYVKGVGSISLISANDELYQKAREAGYEHPWWPWACSIEISATKKAAQKAIAHCAEKGDLVAIGLNDHGKPVGLSILKTDKRDVIAL